MDKSLSHQPVLLPMIGATLGKISKAAAVLLLVLALGVPPQVMFGQSNQQQEQQQREQQQRDQQQREQQEHEQQQREQQQRDQQQRDQQHREQQQREQQEREQQQREQQQREQQQREQQRREEQERDHQQREQQQREQQEREQQQRDQQQRDQQRCSSSDSAAPSSAMSQEVIHRTAQSPRTDVKLNSAHTVNATATKDDSTAVEPDPHHRVCADGPCKEPPNSIQPKPVVSDLHGKLCKDGPCRPCPTGQLQTKDGTCAPAPTGKTVAPPSGVRTAGQQACAPGQVWNGAQCQAPGAQPCPAGQSRVGTSCQVDCTIATASAQNVIVELRSARQRKDDACLRNPTGNGCRQAEADYDLLLTEYRSFLGGVPIECQASLPDPIAI